jgi:hypothetical protein
LHGIFEIRGILAVSWPKRIVDWKKTEERNSILSKIEHRGETLKTIGRCIRRPGTYGVPEYSILILLVTE